MVRKVLKFNLYFDFGYNFFVKFKINLCFFSLRLKKINFFVYN